MPKLNLRLSEAQLALLQQWADHNYRSIQKEIVFRLFHKQQVTEIDAEEFEAARNDPAWKDFTEAADKYVAEVADAQPRDIPARTVQPAPYERSFKPDFKKPSERKKGRR